MGAWMAFRGCVGRIEWPWGMGARVCILGVGVGAVTNGLGCMYERSRRKSLNRVQSPLEIC